MHIKSINKDLNVKDDSIIRKIYTEQMFRLLKLNVIHNTNHRHIKYKISKWN